MRIPFYGSTTGGAQLTRQLNLVARCALHLQSPLDPFTGRSWRLAPQGKQHLPGECIERRNTRRVTSLTGQLQRRRHRGKRRFTAALGIAEVTELKDEFSDQFGRITGVEPVDRINEISPQSLRTRVTLLPQSGKLGIGNRRMRRPGKRGQRGQYKQQHSMSPTTFRDDVMRARLHHCQTHADVMRSG